MAANKARKYAFVPKLLVRTAVAGVIPACALAVADACGGSTSTPAADSGSEQQFTVAAVAYPAYEAGRPDVFGVAAVAYPAYESGAPDSPAADAPSDVGTSPDVFGVAAVAYPAYEAGTG